MMARQAQLMLLWVLPTNVGLLFIMANYYVIP